MNKNKLLNCISAAQFAVVELKLFLDTHPYNKEALSKLDAARVKLREYIKQFEDEYGPLTIMGDFGNDGYDWIKNPWPWEKEAN